MRKNTYLIFFIAAWLFPAIIIAQKQNNSWFFGNQSGIDFNSIPPIIPEKSTSASLFPEYSTAISDRNGLLQFYSDGRHIWGKNHRKMKQPAGKWWWIDVGTIMPLICPVPGNEDLYYLFLAVAVDADERSFFYVTIDMKGNGGNGEVLYSPDENNPVDNYQELLKQSSAFLAGTQHCNKKDYWIVTHKLNAFYSYLVTDAGVSGNPVLSTVSPVILPGAVYENLNIKFSASGEKMIVPVQNQGAIVVFDFDNKTGKLSNPIKLGIPPGKILYDIEISPDGSKLYYGAKYFEPVSDDFSAELDMIYQMDLFAGPNPSAIEATNTALIPFPDRSSYPVRGPPNILNRTMQLAPEGRIYVGMRSKDKSTSIIEDPDRAGFNCRYIRSGFSLQKQYNNINFNYIRSISFVNKENSIQAQKGACDKQPVQFSLVFNKADSVKWNFGDLASGSNNFSIETSPKHIFTKEGNYTISAIIYQACFTDTAIKKVSVQPDVPLNPTFQPKDTAFCEGGELLLNVTTQNATNYIWSDGSFDTLKRIREADSYVVIIRNRCHIKSYDFTVEIIDCPCDVYVPNAFTPNTDGHNDRFKPGVYCAISNYSLQIFNRFGSKVFETSNYLEGWDGKFKSLDQPGGIYIWLLKYYDPSVKKIITKKGTFVLLR